jgi:hypothetical protein
VLVVGVLAGGAPAEAASSASVDLRWDAPASCPGEPALRSEIDRLLEGLDRPATRLDARIVVVEYDQRWRLDLALTVDSQVGERSFDAGSCSELVDAVAITIAIAVNPRALERVAVSEPQPAGVDGEAVKQPTREEELGDGPSDSEPSISEPEQPPEAARERREKSRALAIGAAGGIGIAMLPGVAGNVQFELALLSGRWRIGVDGSLWLPKELESPQSAGIGGRFLLWSAGVRGCFVPGPAPQWSIPLCVAADAGAMRGEGIGQLEAAAAQSPYVAIRGGPGLSWSPVPALAVQLSTHAVIPLIRPAFSTDPSGLVYRASPAGFRALLGLEWRISTKRRPRGH